MYERWHSRVWVLQFFAPVLFAVYQSLGLFVSFEEVEVHCLHSQQGAPACARLTRPSCHFVRSICMQLAVHIWLPGSGDSSFFDCSIFECEFYAVMF